MSLSVRETNQPNKLNSLPDEVLRKILELLSLDALLSCERVCRRWRALAADRALWARHLVEHSEHPREERNNLPLISSHGDHICVLSLRHVGNYETVKFILGRCVNVTSLTLVRCKLKNDFKTDLEKCMRLKKLDIQTCDLVDDPSDCAIDFSNFSHLSYISLSNFGLSASNCDKLLYCRFLTHIYIEKVKHLSLEFVERLITCRQSTLEALHVEGGEAVQDDCLRLLARCPRLRELALASGAQLTDAGLLALAELKSMERLKICCNSNFTENCLLSVFKSGSFSALQSLDLSGVHGVSSNVVDVISERCPNIRCLILYKCPKLVGCKKYLDVKLRNITVAVY